LKKLLKYSSLVFALALYTSSYAHAESLWDILFGNKKPPIHQNPSPPKHRNPTQQAPEVDPALAISGFSLLAGTLTVLRARHRK
jgi:hypothetical protein